MIQFKTWIEQMGEHWYVLRSSAINDQRPFRVIQKFETEEQAKNHLDSLWRMF